MVRKKLLVLVALAAIACRPATPLQLETIQTGKSLNSDNSVGNHTTRFRPNDTMNVAILTKGAGSGKIGVRWTLGGRVVNEESRDVSYRDSAATEFRGPEAKPRKTLTAWERYAQVLLLANEFMFVD